MEKRKQNPEASGKQMAIFSSPHLTSLIQVPALPLTCCVTLGKSLSLSGPVEIIIITPHRAWAKDKDIPWFKVGIQYCGNFEDGQYQAGLPLGV